jgi:hypothetical protein
MSIEPETDFNPELLYEAFSGSPASSLMQKSASNQCFFVSVTISRKTDKPVHR